MTPPYDKSILAEVIASTIKKNMPLVVLLQSHTEKIDLSRKSK